MAYFPDLSPYAYGNRSCPGVVHVGWLDETHPFQRGTVEPALIEKLKGLVANPVNLCLGHHVCEICPRPDFEKESSSRREFLGLFFKWSESRRGNGEIHISNGAVTFAAPVLILHYINEHSYLPPIEFLEALGEA